ncbi:MAG TPA: tetratricopeptide repeat protein [Anaerolineaceae bacterium]|nr:tetratricopeptide repeat protein [Anaerolineaceae bacterium]
MPSELFDQLIEKADQSARLGDWAETINVLQQAQAIQPDHVGVLTGMGTCLIQTNQVMKAIPYFQKVAELAPGSAEAHNNLGVAYVFDQDFVEAEQAYKAALEVNPEHLPTWKNLANLYLQQADKAGEGVQILASIVKRHPEDVEALLLLADCYEYVAQIDSAITLCKQVLSIDPENPDAKKKIEKYKPSKVDLGGVDRSELIKKLSVLKKLKASGGNPEEVDSSPVMGDTLLPPGVKKVGLFVSEGSQVYDRAGQLTQVFEHLGRKVNPNPEFSPDDLQQNDLLVFMEPMVSANLVNGINACIQKNKPFMIDIGQDYFERPANHKGYSQVGPGNPESLRTLEIILRKADRVTVPSKVLADRFSRFSANVKVVLPGWVDTNILWKKSKPARDTINIGWIGTFSDSIDLLSIKKDILRILRTYPETKLLVCEDLEAYKSFSAISERRRGFLPAPVPEDLPYLMMQFDILVVPLEDNEYNRAKSDELMVTAGVRKIPWVASPIPAFNDWQAGGVIVESKCPWYGALADLVENAEDRTKLGEAGEQKALSRKSFV